MAADSKNEINENYIKSLELQIKKLNLIISSLTKTLGYISYKRNEIFKTESKVCEPGKVIEIYPQKSKVKSMAL
jgi:hypothetical protein